MVAIAMLCSCPVFAQDKAEHGLLVGAGAGFPMQDETKFALEPRNGYLNDVKANGMLGYRFRFLPQRRFFVDLDATLGFQGMQTYEFKAAQVGIPYWEQEGVGTGKSFTDFIMPLALTATCNYRITEKFFAGLGLSPTLYILPQAAFDLGVAARIGYRVSKRCELGLSYQYGCLNVLKHFNDGPAMGRRGHFSDLMLSVYIPFSIK